jgi:predicted Zn-ribbon and HTH transcriptional regulator
MSDKIKLPTFHCLRCEHTWIPRKPEKPKRCARCKSPYWETERKVKNVTETI